MLASPRRGPFSRAPGESVPGRPRENAVRIDAPPPHVSKRRFAKCPRFFKFFWILVPFGLIRRLAGVYWGLGWAPPVCFFFLETGPFIVDFFWRLLGNFPPRNCRCPREFLGMGPGLMGLGFSR